MTQYIFYLLLKYILKMTQYIKYIIRLLCGYCTQDILKTSIAEHLKSTAVVPVRGELS